MDMDTNGVYERPVSGEVAGAQAEVGEQAEPFFFSTRLPVWKYALVMAVISFVPSILLSFGLGAAGVMTEESGPELGGFGPGIDFGMIVLLSPVVETLLMGVILEAPSFISRRRRYVLVAMPCIAWAALKVLHTPVLWGLVVLCGLLVFCPFFVFSCSFISRRRYVLAAMSCGVWAGLHSLFSPAWGLVVFWPFFVFSCSYLAWRRRSWRHAVCVTSLIHMLHNLLPGLAIAVKGFAE